MDIIKRLRPVTYNFTGNEARPLRTAYNEYAKNNMEIELNQNSRCKRDTQIGRDISAN